MHELAWIALEFGPSWPLGHFQSPILAESLGIAALTGIVVINIIRK